MQASLQAGRQRAIDNSYKCVYILPLYIAYAAYEFKRQIRGHIVFAGIQHSCSLNSGEAIQHILIDDMLTECTRQETTSH